MKGFYALFFKELLRFRKVLFQTVLSPIINSLLYLIIFKNIYHNSVNIYNNVLHINFIVPGILMMTILQNSFSNSSSSVIQSKISGSIIFLLLSPLSNLEIFFAYIIAASVRGICVGFFVFILMYYFVHIYLFSFLYILFFSIFGSLILGSIGLIAGIVSDKFDNLIIFQNFLITPLTFLSGTFYSLHSLPFFLKKILFFNPFYYLIDGFRYGFIGFSDVSPVFSFIIIIIFFLFFSILTFIILVFFYKLDN